MSWWQSLGLPGAQIDKASIRFPLELELVPDVLKAQITVTSFNMGEEELTCWTYATVGLKKTGQKELLLSIRKLPGETIGDFPQAPLEFFKTVFQHALRQEFIDIGSVSDFGENGFLSSSFTAAAYIRSQAMGDWFPPEDSLAAILMTDDELKASQIGGLTRVLALLGKSSLHFPCPVWNDLSRHSVVADLLPVMQESFISELPRILVRNSGVSAADRVIDLQLPLSSRFYFSQLQELEKDTPMMILADLDERADALLVFQPEKKAAPLAISAPGTPGSRIAGSFICFAPAQAVDQGMIIEDGFVITMREQPWVELKNSLLNGSPFYLSRQDDGYDFRLAWTQDEAQAPGPETIQVSGIELGCSNYKKGEEAEKTTVPAYATGINVLTHESEIKKLIDMQVLRRYIDHIEDIVRDHFLCMGETDGFDLNLTCAILPERKAEFEVKSNPVMEADDETDLLDRLAITYAPEISEGTIKFSLDICVWGGK